MNVCARALAICNEENVTRRDLPDKYFDDGGQCSTSARTDDWRAIARVPLGLRRAFLARCVAAGLWLCISSAASLLAAARFIMAKCIKTIASDLNAGPFQEKCKSLLDKQC